MAKNKKNIAILYSGKKNYGGIYTFFRDILKNVKIDNLQIDLFCIFEELPLEKYFSNIYKLNVPEWFKKIIFKFNLHMPIGSLLAIFFLNKLKNYDLVLINQELSFPISLFLKNTKTIIHGSSLVALKAWLKENKYPKAFYYFIYSINTVLTYLSSKEIYTVSEFTKKYVEKFNKNVKVCGWGVDLKFWKYNKNIKKKLYGFSDTDFLMIFVGRFDYGKGKDKLLNIMEEFSSKEEYKNIKLICVSKKPKNFKELEKLNIYFFENLSEKEIRNLYSISDLFIFPSRYEGYGSVIAEAMAIGLPIITTNTGLGWIIKNKYKNNKEITNRIKILETYADYKDFIEKIKNFYKLWKKKKLNKKRIYIEEIDLEKALKCWKKIFEE